MNQTEEKMALQELVDTFAILADEMKLHEQAQLFTEDGVLVAYWSRMQRGRPIAFRKERRSRRAAPHS